MTKMPILEVYKDKKGLFRFKLVARDGTLVLESVGFEKKANALAKANKLAEWTSKALLVDADKKADAASKTTGKQSLKQTAHKKAEPSKATPSATTKLRK
jgi:uncharacterized protein YegP (UPF0339 family)